MRTGARRAWVGCVEFEEGIQTVRGRWRARRRARSMMGLVGCVEEREAAPPSSRSLNLRVSKDKAVESSLHVQR